MKLLLLFLLKILVFAKTDVDVDENEATKELLEQILLLLMTRKTLGTNDLVVATRVVMLLLMHAVVLDSVLSLLVVVG